MTTFRHDICILLTVGFLLLLVACGASAVTVVHQENRLLIDGKPMALTFARNCTEISDLPAYRALGFNTLLVTIDSPAPRALEKAQALIAAAEQQQLYILIELANGDWSASEYADTDGEEYKQNCGYFLDMIVPKFCKHPNLAGWIVSTVDERQSVADPGSFVDFLLRKYKSIDELNRSWTERDVDDNVKSSLLLSMSKLQVFPTAKQLLRLTTNKVIQQKITSDGSEYDTLLNTRDRRFRAFLQKLYPSFNKLQFTWQCDRKEWHFDKWDDITVDALVKHEEDDPESCPSSMLDLAQFKAAFSPVLLDWWTGEVAKRDADHRVFAGCQHSYRTLSTLPRSLDGALTECYPGFAEPDEVSQNPHAIDIARHGNQFAVLAGVLVPGMTANDICNAVYAAAVHGAAGLCFADWPTLTATTDDAAPLTNAVAVRDSLAYLAQHSLLGRTPAPTVALVYCPYVAGYRIGNCNLYGYLESSTFISGPGNLGTLFFELRNGTGFGQFDYLSGDDLTRVSLQNYQAILMPSALDIPRAAQQELKKYVYNGGTLVADLGVGTMQATKDLLQLPDNDNQDDDSLRFLFHVSPMLGLEDVRLNLEVAQPNPRFPHMLPGLRTSGMNGGFMITRIMKVLPMEGTLFFGTTVATTKYQMPMLRPPTPMLMRPSRGMYYYQFGKGQAIYAPFPLYQYWLPENQLFGEFHHDLFSLNARVFLQRPIDFIPLLAEVAAYTDGSIVTWTKDATRPETEVANPERRFYNILANTGSCLVSPDDTTLLHYDVAGLNLAEPLPIYAEHTPLTLKFTTTAAVSPTALEFDIDAAGDVPKKTVILRIGSGEYAIAPKSNHRVAINDKTIVVKADDKGLLTLKFVGEHTHLRIEPGTPQDEGKEVIFNVTGPGDDYEIDVHPVEEAPKKPATETTF